MLFNALDPVAHKKNAEDLSRRLEENQLQERFEGDMVIATSAGS